ncbi:MAG: hypothetical protein N3F05_04940 [Candidatus Diapherotrites archaeon]|nr:hypothetical protein [Candidatus Diapherotrites archaeon]
MEVLKKIKQVESESLALVANAEKRCESRIKQARAEAEEILIKARVDAEKMHASIVENGRRKGKEEAEKINAKAALEMKSLEKKIEEKKEFLKKIAFKVLLNA